MAEPAAIPEGELTVLSHTADAIGRTGATSLEVGWLDDTPPHRWWFESRIADQPAGSYCVRRLDPDGWSGCEEAP